MAGVGGPPGNDKRAKQYRIKETFAKLLEERSSRKEGIDELKALCGKVLDSAKEGDLAAFREFADRFEGKVPSVVQGPGEKGEFVLKVSQDDAKL